MIENLKFYGISTLIGFIISIGWWNAEKEKIGIPCLALLIPAFWALAASLIISVKDEGRNFLEALAVSLDVRYFYRGYGWMESRSVGALAMFSVAFFVLGFRWLWLFKNQRSQS